MTPANNRVCVLLPWYKSTSPVTAFALLSMLDKSRMSVMLQFNDAFIAHSRNKLAENFLRTKADWGLMIDDDTVPPCGNAKWFNTFTKLKLPEKFAGVHLVDRLLSHGKSLVGGHYWSRAEESIPVYSEGRADIEWLRKGPHDVCKPVKWVGSGAMLIHRSVFEDIEKKFPHLARNAEGKKGQWFTSSEHELRKDVSTVSTILADGSLSQEARILKAQEILRGAEARTAAHSGLGSGEDVAFCIRAAQAGHQPHVDLGCICGHIGTHVYGPKC